MSKDVEQNQGWLLDSLDNGNETISETINAENGNVIVSSNNENEENAR